MTKREWTIGVIALVAAFGVGLLYEGMTAPNIVAGGSAATSAGWTQRGTGGKWNLVYRDEDYHPIAGASLWDTCPAQALRDPYVANVFFDDFFDWGCIEGDPVGSNTKYVVTEAFTQHTQTTSTTMPSCLRIETEDSGTSSTNRTGLQLRGSAFDLIAGSAEPIWFEARVMVTSTTLFYKTNFVVGLCITDTTLCAGMTDGVYFRVNDWTNDIYFVTEKNSTETATDTGVDLTEAVWYRLGFWWDGTNATPYINGTVKTANTTNVPNDLALTPSFEVRACNDDSIVAGIDYIKAVQVRE